MSNVPTPPPSYAVAQPQTITILERVTLAAIDSEALTLRRIELSKPADYLEANGRKN